MKTLKKILNDNCKNKTNRNIKRNNKDCNEKKKDR